MASRQPLYPSTAHARVSFQKVTPPTGEALKRQQEGSRKGLTTILSKRKGPLFPSTARPRGSTPPPQEAKRRTPLYPHVTKKQMEQRRQTGTALMTPLPEPTFYTEQAPVPPKTVSRKRKTTTKRGRK